MSDRNVKVFQLDFWSQDNYSILLYGIPMKIAESIFKNLKLSINNYW
jgi:hypothetical protein